MKYAFLLLSIFGIIVSNQAQRNFNNNWISQPNIYVKGYGFEEVTPDEIYIKAVIRDEKDNPVEDQQTELIKALQNIGVSNDDITLFNEGGYFGKLTWRAKELVQSETLSIKVKDADEVNKVFKVLDDRKVHNGYIYMVDYSKREEIEKMVRIEAIADAKSRANDMLKAIGSTAGKPLQIAEVPTLDYTRGDLSLLAGNQYSDNFRTGSFYKKGESNNIEFTKIKIEYSLECCFSIE